MTDVRPNDPLDAALALIAARGPDAGSIWRHRKGSVYRVLTCAVREADLVPVVVYRDHRPAGMAESLLTWTRPLAEFADGRFSLVAPRTEGVDSCPAS